MNDKDKEAFDEWRNSTSTRLDIHDAWQAACEYVREKISLDQARSNRVFVDMARKLCEAEKELAQWKEAARSEAEEVNRLQAENKKLREALEFYANPLTWQHLSDDAWDDDVIGLNSFDDCLKHCEVDGVKILTGGKRANEALKEVDEKL